MQAIKKSEFVIFACKFWLARRFLKFKIKFTNLYWVNFTLPFKFGVTFLNEFCAFWRPYGLKIRKFSRILAKLLYILRTLF